MRSDGARRALAAAVLAAMALAAVSALAGVSVPVWPAAVTAAAAGGTLSLAENGKRPWLGAAVWAASCIAALLLCGEASAGVGRLAEDALAVWQRVQPRIYPTFIPEGTGETGGAVVLCVTGVLLGGISAAYVRKPEKWAFRGAAAVLCAGAAAVSPAASPTGLLLAAVTVLLLYALRFGGGGTSGAAARVWLRAAAVVLAAAAVLGGWGEDVSPAQTVARTAIEDAAGAIRYGSNRPAGLTDGQLTRAGERSQTEEPMLTVTMTAPASYYLRGFVGEVYDGSRWRTLDSETLAEAADDFYWLHSGGFYGQTQLATASAAADSALVETENAVTVTNQGASSRYVYAPYELLAGDAAVDAGAIGDAAIYGGGLRGQRSYTLHAAENLVVRYQYTAAKLAENGGGDYLENEGRYNRFVYRQYTSLPAEVSAYLGEKLGGYQAEEGQRHFDYQKAKQNILYYLTTYITYSETVPAVPEGVDFVLSFLDGSQAGYDVHYATAAAMMFRYYGIPARYVEGFLVTKDEAAGLTPGETLTLDGTHGHAWVEYYQDGVGWLPFEVTPSYFSTMEQAETYQDISGLVGRAPLTETADNVDSDTENDTDDPSLLSFWLKYRLAILLAVSILLAAALLVLFIGWLICRRRQTARRKAAFLGENIPRAIRGIWLYLMDVLLAGDMKAGNCPPEAYAPYLDEDLRPAYTAAAAIWQEARFSRHEMTESQRQQVLTLTEEVWHRTWQRAGLPERIRLKYVLFL